MNDEQHTAAIKRVQASFREMLPEPERVAHDPVTTFAGVARTWLRGTLQASSYASSLGVTADAVLPEHLLCVTEERYAPILDRASGEIYERALTRGEPIFGYVHQSMMLVRNRLERAIDLGSRDVVAAWRRGVRFHNLESDMEQELNELLALRAVLILTPPSAPGANGAESPQEQASRTGTSAQESRADVSGPEPTGTSTSSELDAKQKRAVALMTDGQREIWDLLGGRPVPAKEIASRLRSSEDSVRQKIHRMKKAGLAIESNSGGGYFRPDVVDGLSRDA